MRPVGLNTRQSQTITDDPWVDDGMRAVLVLALALSGLVYRVGCRACWLCRVGFSLGVRIEEMSMSMSSSRKDDVERLNQSAVTLRETIVE